MTSPRILAPDFRCIVIRRGLPLESSMARTLAIGEEILAAPSPVLHRVIDRRPDGSVAVVPA